MASKIKVDQIEGSTASTVSLPSGQTLDLSSGSITLPDSAVDLSSAKVTGILGTGNLPNIPEANLPTIPVSKGGTGVTSLGSARQVIKVNSGGTALEFGSGGGIGNIYQVTYKDSTSYSGAGRTNSDVVTGLNATFTRQSQTSKTLLSYSLHVGSTDDCWIYLKYNIQQMVLRLQMYQIYQINIIHKYQEVILEMLIEVVAVMVQIMKQVMLLMNIYTTLQLLRHQQFTTE